MTRKKSLNTKKIFASLLVLILVLGTLALTGCGKKNKASDEETSYEGQVDDDATKYADNDEPETEETEEYETFTLADGQVAVPETDAAGEVVLDDNGKVSYVTEKGDKVDEALVPEDVTKKNETIKETNETIKAENESKIAENTAGTGGTSSNSGSSNTSGTNTSGSGTSGTSGTGTSNSGSSSAGTNNTGSNGSTGTSGSGSTGTSGSGSTGTSGTGSSTNPTQKATESAKPTSYTKVVEHMTFLVEPDKKTATYQLPAGADCGNGIIDGSEASEKNRDVKTINIPDTIDGCKCVYNDQPCEFCYCTGLTVTIPANWTQKNINEIHIDSLGFHWQTMDSDTTFIWNTTNPNALNLASQYWAVRNATLCLPNINAADITFKSDDGKTSTKFSSFLGDFNQTDSAAYGLNLPEIKIVFKDGTYDARLNR